MTNTPPVEYSQPPAQETPPPAKKSKNTVGLIAFIVAVVGFIFACVPGALIVGWIALPIAFILAIVSLFMKGKTKGLGITALIISVVGTIVGVIVFMSVVATSFDEAFGGGEVTVTAPEEEAAEVVDEEPTEAEVGTRDNPYPLGTTIEQGDWAVTINSVDLNATDALMASDLYNESPGDGNVYMMTNLTATYNGDNPDGETPWVTVDYVTVEGNTINGLDQILIAPDEFDIMSTLYDGASTTGNQALEIPADTAADGVLAVSPTIAGDTFYFQVQ
ncbi:MAG: hypothetical protein ACTHW3_04635 [Leucobacter sp.]